MPFTYDLIGFVSYLETELLTFVPRTKRSMALQ